MRVRSLTFVARTRDFIAGHAGTCEQFDRVLVTPSGRCIVLAQNSFPYFSHDGVDFELVANALRGEGTQVSEVIETYPPNEGRIPWFASPQRSFDEAVEAFLSGRSVEPATMRKYTRILCRTSEFTKACNVPTVDQLRMKNLDPYRASSELCDLSCQKELQLLGSSVAHAQEYRL